MKYVEIPPSQRVCYGLGMQKTFGQLAFDTYNDHGPNAGKTYDGKPIPPWGEIAEHTRERWEASARAVKHAAERALLDQFTATIANKANFGDAFERAVKRYDLECQAHNGPLALKVLFDIFAAELAKS